MHNPLGREFGHVTKTVTAKHYRLLQPITSSQRYVINDDSIIFSHFSRTLTDGFYFQELKPSHAEYIADFWPHWRNVPKLQKERFHSAISLGGSVGIFTTSNELVSWAVRSIESGEIHHLYTLEEYRGRGLASAVVREMSRRIQDKGEVPFTYIKVGNDVSISLFQALGFVDEGLYCFLVTQNNSIL